MNDLSDDQIQRIRDVNDANGLIEAIKVHREMTGASLAESKSAVEALVRGETRTATGQLSHDTVSEITEHLAEGRRIQAIKVYRDATNASLLDAKNFIESLMVRLREEDPDRFPAARSGCAGVLLLISLGSLLTESFLLAICSL